MKTDQKPSRSYLLLIFQYFIIVTLLCGCSDNKMHKFILSKDIKTIKINDSKDSLDGFSITFSENEKFNQNQIAIKETESPLSDEQQFYSLSPSVSIAFSEGEKYKLIDSALITIPINRNINNIPVAGYFNEELKKWEFIKIEKYDSINHTLSFKTAHFSIFKAMEINIGGVDNLISNINLNFSKITPLLFDGNYQTNSNIPAGLKEIKEKSYLNLKEMNSNYDQCKSQASCKLIYEDLINSISETIITQSTEKILTDIVLKGVGGASVVSTAFFIGDIISTVVITDCLICYLPNSTLSSKFWVNYFTYFIAEQLIKEMNNASSLNDKCICEPKLEDVDKNIPVIKSLSKYEGNIGDIIEIGGCNFSGFEHDTDAWIENEKGVRGFLSGQDGSNDNLIRIKLEYELCQVNNNYSGEPCNSWLTLEPGVYLIFVHPWNTVSNKVSFKILGSTNDINKTGTMSLQDIYKYLLNLNKIDNGDELKFNEENKNIDLNDDNIKEILVFNFSKAGAGLAPTFLLAQNPLRLIGEGFGPRIELLPVKTKGYFDIKDYGPYGYSITKWNGVKYLENSYHKY
jgi:hypothetical protein